MVRRKDDICRKKERYPDEITSPSLFYIKGGDLFLFTHLTVDVSVFIYLFTSIVYTKQQKQISLSKQHITRIRMSGR